MRGSPSVNHPGFREFANRVFLRAAGPGRPRVLTPEEVFPALRTLEEDFPALQAEIDTLLASRSIPTYDVFDPVRAAQVSLEWKLYYAYMYGRPNELARTECPTLLAFAQSHPNVVNAFVSVLDPGVGLPAQQGTPTRESCATTSASAFRPGPAAHPAGPGALHVEGGRGPRAGRVRGARGGQPCRYPAGRGHRRLHRPMGVFASALNRWCLRLKRKWAPRFVDASRYDVMHAA